jgi:hypothetical protein
LYNFFWYLVMNVFGGDILALCVTSGFCREVDNYALLGYYVANSGNFLPTFRYKLSAPSSGFKYARREMGPIGGQASSVRNYHYSLFRTPQERNSNSGPTFMDQRWRKYVQTKTSVPTNQIARSHNAEDSNFES